MKWASDASEKSKRVLVTGGTGVLGSALTRELCAQGFEVVAWFRSNEERAAQLGMETGCKLWQGDAADEREVEDIFATFQFEAIVHLAGWNQNALMLQTSPLLWEKVLHSHLQSSFLMCRAALTHLPRGGQLVLVSSRVGLIGNGGQSAYAAAKAGVFGLMKTAAFEGRERGVRVNVLCPGFAPGAGELLAKRELLRREREDLIRDNDAAQSFAAFTTWLLASNSDVSGQILRPDCRI